MQDVEIKCPDDGEGDTLCHMADEGWRYEVRNAWRGSTTGCRILERELDG